MSLVMTILALALVLVIAWFIIRFLAKMNQLHPSSTKRMQILQTVAVGTRERLVLVRYRERDILLGVTAGGISVVDNNKTDANELEATSNTTPDLQARDIIE